MSEEDRNYYAEFASEAKQEYEKQLIEYRATGSFAPSKYFDRLDGVNVWVRRDERLQNGLEREISQYATCQFPKRPPEMDKAYEEREERSKLKRKLKLKGLLNPDGSLKNDLDFEQLLQEERAKKDPQLEDNREATDDVEDTEFII